MKKKDHVLVYKEIGKPACVIVTSDSKTVEHYKDCAKDRGMKGQMWIQEKGEPIKNG